MHRAAAGRNRPRRHPQAKAPLRRGGAARDFGAVATAQRQRRRARADLFALAGRGLRLPVRAQGRDAGRVDAPAPGGNPRDRLREGTRTVRLPQPPRLHRRPDRRPPTAGLPPARLLGQPDRPARRLQARQRGHERRRPQPGCAAE